MKQLFKLAPLALLIASLSTPRLLAIGEEVWHADIHYEDMELFEECTMEALLALRSDVQAFVGSDVDEATVLEKSDELYDFYSKINTRLKLLNILYSQDVSDSTISEQFLQTANLRNTAKNVLIEAVMILLQQTPHGTAVWNHMSDSLQTRILTTLPTSETALTLIAEENELVANYNRLDAQGFSVELNGTIVTLDNVYSLGLSAEEIQEVRTALMLKKNEVLGGIYLELVGIRRKIAGEFGYDNYSDYYYAQVRERNYTPEQMQGVHAFVKQYITPYYLKVRYLEDHTASVDYTEVSSELLLSELSTILTEDIPEYYPVYDYMTSHGLYNIGSSENREDASMAMKVYHYNAPFLFLNIRDTSDNLMTLIHEFGHYLHFYSCSKDETLYGPLNQDLMEIPSLGLESLLTGPRLNKLSPSTAKSIEVSAISSMLNGGIMWNCMYDKFEQAAYNTPDLTLDDLNLLYAQSYREYYNWDVPEGTRAYGWSDNWHIFNDPLYQISYTMSQLPALALWSRAKEDFESAKAQYATLVEGASSGDYPGTLAEAGIPTPFEEALYQEIAAALDSFLADNALPLNFQVNKPEPDAPGLQFRFSGIPGQSVAIECKESLNAPDWTPVASGVFDEAGIFEITDDSPAANCFYHAVYE